MKFINTATHLQTHHTSHIIAGLGNTLRKSLSLTQSAILFRIEQKCPIVKLLCRIDAKRDILISDMARYCIMLFGGSRDMCAREECILYNAGLVRRSTLLENYRQRNAIFNLYSWRQTTHTNAKPLMPPTVHIYWRIRICSIYPNVAI